MREKPRTPPPVADDDLEFLRDEGLDLLALFKRIHDPRKRALVIELMRAIADGQPPTDGDA